MAQQHITPGAVDRLRLMTLPRFAGDAGRAPAFANVASADLELVDHRVLDGQAFRVENRPTGNGIPRG